MDNRKKEIPHSCVTGAARLFDGGYGVHTWRRLLLRHRGELLMGPTEPHGQGHCAGHIQLQAWCTRCV